MKQWIAVMFAVVVGVGGARPAHAQALTQGSGTVEITLVPGGATFFTQGKDTKAPSFINYGAGAGVHANLNRFVGVEGEVIGSFGVTQNLDFTAGTVNRKSPNLLDYSGNLVVSAATGGSVVPYVTGGVGGLTLFNEPALGIANTETFLTGNVGGGVKWFNGRWGLRGDYRFIAVRSKDDAPAFFGRETRYGHRVYGGVLIAVGR
jgi:hypothetical protein